MVDPRRHASFALVAIIALTAPSMVSAQPADARALLREGFAARRAQRDADALRAFESALAIDAGASTLAQVALAEHALGRWADAERHLLECLSSSDPWITRNEAELRAALVAVRSHLASLVLDGGPDGATVSLDGRAVGTLPLQTPLRVTAGSVILRVTAAGHHALERPLSVTAGETLRESLSIVREAPPEPTPVLVPSPAPASVPVLMRREVIPSRRPWAPWVLVGGGALTLGVAAALSLLRGVAVDDLRARCDATDIAATDAVECPPDAGARAVHDRATLYRDGSLIALGIGSAAVVAGLVWWIASPTRRAHAPVSLGPQGATLRWNF